MIMQGQHGIELLSSQCCLNTSKKTIAQKNHLCNVDPRAHGTGKLSHVTVPRSSPIPALVNKIC